VDEQIPYHFSEEHAELAWGEVHFVKLPDQSLACDSGIRWCGASENGAATGLYISVSSCEVPHGGGNSIWINTNNDEELAESADFFWCGNGCGCGDVPDLGKLLH